MHAYFFLLLFKRALNGYKFSVYTTEFCPRNQNEWQNRSSTLNCTDDSYMCIPNEHLTELLEFCYTKPITNIPPGKKVVNIYICIGIFHDLSLKIMFHMKIQLQYPQHYFSTG